MATYLSTVLARSHRLPPLNQSFCRHFAVASQLRSTTDERHYVKPAGKVLKLLRKGKSAEERHPDVFSRYNQRRLKLAQQTDDPRRFKPREQPKEPKIVTLERKLPSLAESALPYQKYSKETVEEYENFETYYDPLFNPNLVDERHRVNPEEEPFSAIYADNHSTEAAQEYTKVRNITTPELWACVERLARTKIAPKPRLRKADEPIQALPSGFVPPPETPPDLPYFIARTRNYLLPVYYFLDDEPDKCYTVVKQVTGDLWRLEEDLRGHLQSLQKSDRRILTSVHETDERVLFRGRHLHEIVDWLHQKGF